MKLKGILIDPIKRSIERVEVERGDDPEQYAEFFKSLYALIGNGCTGADMVRMSAYDAFYVHDEGLYVDWDTIGFFSFEGHPQRPFAGRAVVLGLDQNNGDPLNAHVLLSDLWGSVVWRDPKGVAVPAPRLETAAGTTFLHGVEEWTYLHQPK